MTQAQSKDPDVIGEPSAHVTPTALGQLVRGEIDMQIETAHRYPRDILKFKTQAIEMATMDAETAEGCFYALRRKGGDGSTKIIEGPSVRLAEIVVSCWGNVRAGSRIIEEGEKFVTAQAICHDLETNVAIGVDVRRRITNKYGKRYGDDMIGTTCNAAISIALRNAVFKVVPMVYTRSIFEKARKTAIGDATTLEERRNVMLAHFGKMGLEPERVFAAIDKANIEQIGLDELGILKGLATAIKDGDTTVDDAFPPLASSKANVRPPERKTAPTEGDGGGACDSAGDGVTTEPPAAAGEAEPPPAADPAPPPAEVPPATEEPAKPGVAIEVVLKAWKKLGPSDARKHIADNFDIEIEGAVNAEMLANWSEKDLLDLYGQIRDAMPKP